MKISSLPKYPFTSLCATLLCATLAHAAPLYWDINGTTLGAGNPATGAWGVSGSNTWNSASDGGNGGSFTDTTTSLDDLYFVAGGTATSGSSAYTVTVSGTQAANSLNFQSQGNSTLSGGVIELGAGGIIGAATAFSGSTRGSVAISSALVLQANQSFSNNGTTTMTLSGGITGSADLEVKANGTGAINLSTNAVDIAGSLSNTGTGSGLVTISAPIGGNVTGITQNSATSQLTLSGSNAFTGSVSVLSGTLRLSSANAVGTSAISLGASSGTNDATLWVSATTSNSINVQGGNTGTATINVASTLTTGTTTLDGGHDVTINLANQSRMTQRIVESGGASAVTINANAANFNTAFFGNSSNSYSGGTAINNNGYLTFGTGGAGTWVGTGTLTINGSVNINQQSSSATINGIPTLVLNNNFNVSGGSSSIGLVFSSTTAVNLGDTGTATERILNVGSILTFNGTVSDGSNGFTNGIDKQGTGLLVLSGNNNYTGNTTVTSGTLRISGGSDRLPTGTILTVKSGTTAAAAGVFDLNAQNQSVAGLSGDNTNAFAGTVTNNAGGTGTATLTVNPDSAGSPSDTTFAGIIKNGTTAKVALTKEGSHALTLSGVNTYTGATTVNAGTLLVNGSLAAGSAVTVDGGLLGGTGTAAGSVTVNDAGAIGAGNSIGTLNTGALALNNTAEMQVEIDIASSTSVTFDSINVTGNFDLDINNTAVLSLSNIGSNVALDLGTVITFVDYSGSWNGGTFSGLADDSQFSFGANTYAISYNGVDGLTSAVTLEVVPEPSTVALAFAGLGIFLLLQRSRRRLLPE